MGGKKRRHLEFKEGTDPSREKSNGTPTTIPTVPKEEAKTILGCRVIWRGVDRPSYVKDIIPIYKEDATRASPE